MKVLYFRPDTVDCTADPHYVNYADVDEMLNDVLKVLESDLVKSIPSVTVYGYDDEVNEGTLFDSDNYATWDLKKTGKVAKGQHAERHKVVGLYFYSDAKDAFSIPPGITGYRAVREMIEEKKLSIDDVKSVYIGVVWTFANDHSCSDYITIDPGAMTVNYENQDWWQGLDTYEKHCADLSELIGHHIEAHPT